MSNFVITGVAGYIAPRHLQAIKETGNRLDAALDPHDSVGILDNYFDDVSFFTEFERFDRHLEKLRRGPDEHRVHYMSICSPNHLHDAHIRLALRVGADAICEKPVVLNPWNLEALQKLEEEAGRRVYTVLQLRLHPSLIALKKSIGVGRKRRYDVSLTYITARGPWYTYSWKGAVQKSGGLATNIGIHFFDLLIWLFGRVISSELHMAEPKRMAGIIELEEADVSWFLSIDRNDMPPRELEQKKRTYRSILVDGNEIEFTDGFANLHTRVYEEILSGRGQGIPDARPSIELVHRIRSSTVVAPKGLAHPYVLSKAGAAHA